MARPAKDWIGVRKGRLVVVARTGTKGTCPLYLVRCDCGTEKELTSASLGGATVSCGCYRAEHGTRTRHSHAGKQKTRTYKVWLSMRSRCHNPKAASYSRYGAKGITVCDRWRGNFENFLHDMGEAPSPRHTIDRIDASSGYAPGNCRWATYEEQAQAKSSAKLTPEIVHLIRSSQETGVMLAARLNVSPTCISTVRRRLTWANID